MQSIFSALVWSIIQSNELRVCAQLRLMADNSPSGLGGERLKAVDPLTLCSFACVDPTMCSICCYLGPLVVIQSW